MMRPAELSRQDEMGELVFPIQFVRVGPLQEVPAPLVRVSTCGRVSLEVLHEVINTDPPLARYRLVNLPERGKGSSTALNLLKLLVSLPAHAATRDWLAEHLPHHRWRRSRAEPEEEEDDDLEAGLLRVDNVVTALRKLLCPPQIEGDHLLRPVLVAFLKNHQDSGPGYQLAPAPLIWLDVEEMASLVQLACQREQQGQEALWLWEEVYALSAKGAYLPLEVYSDWASDRREEIEGYAKQAVLALRRLYLARDGQAAEERVLLLLRTYCRTHSTDEDVLRPLIELLGQRDCVQEALTSYRRLCSLREEEGGEPDPRTQSMIEQVRTMPVKREHEPTTPRKAVPPSPQESLTSSFSLMDGQNSPSSPEGIIEMANTLKGTMQQSGKDMEPSRRYLFQLVPQVVGTAIVSSSPLLEQFARVLAKPTTIDEETFRYLETHTTHYWRDRHSAMIASSLLLEYVLEHLQKILAFLEYSLLPSERRRLCALASGTAQLVGHLFFDLSDYKHARKFHEKAIQAAQEADHMALEAAAWGRMSFTWSYSDNVQKALPYVRQARSLAAGKTTPVVQAYLAAVEAEIQAMLHDQEASLKALSEAEEITTQFESGEELYWLRFDRSRLEGYQGACFRYFYRPEDPQTGAFLTQAQNALKDALALLSPSMIQRRPALLIDLARTFTQQSEVEEACEHAIQAIIILAQ